LKYQNAKTVLPDELLKEIQKYVAGDIIYIPGVEERAGWGRANGARDRYTERNAEIIRLHRKGLDVYQLADRFHLSEYSIRKIVSCRAAKMITG
jgi:DNA-binding NarL/FixJ family response regulator